MPSQDKQHKANRRRGKQLAQEAYRWHDLGRLPFALSMLQKAWNLGYQQPEVLREQAIILFKLHRNQEALSVIEQAIKADSRHALGYALKGLFLFHLGDSGAAVAQHELAIEHAPAEFLAEFYRQKGDLLLHLERFEEALQASEEALGRESTMAQAYVTKGHSLVALDRHEEALEAYQQALALNPQLVTAYMAHGLRNEITVQRR